MRNKKYIIPEISAQSILASVRRTDEGYSFYFDTTDPSKKQACRDCFRKIVCRLLYLSSFNRFVNLKRKSDNTFM